MAQTWTRGRLRYTATPTRPAGTKGADFERLHPRDRRGRFRRKPWAVLNHHDGAMTGGGPAGSTDGFAAWGRRAAAIRRAAADLPNLADLVDDGDHQAAADVLARLVRHLDLPANTRLTQTSETTANGHINATVIAEHHSTQILEVSRGAHRRPDTGALEIHNAGLYLTAGYQGNGWSAILNRALEDWFIASGATRIYLTAQEVGAYAWASAGYDWDMEAYVDRAGDPAAGVAMAQMDISDLLDFIAAHAARDPDTLQRIDTYRRALDGAPEQWPTPYELSRIGWRPGADTWPGRSGMIDAGHADGYWYGEKHLIPPPFEQKGATKAMTTPEPAPAALAARRARLAQLAELHHQWKINNPGADLGKGSGAAEDELHRAVDAAGIFPDVAKTPDT